MWETVILNEFVFLMYRVKINTLTKGVGNIAKITRDAYVYDMLLHRDRSIELFQYYYITTYLSSNNLVL